MAKPFSEQHVQALKERRASCVVACRAIVRCRADRPTKRRALGTLIRYATPRGVQRPGDLRTDGVAALKGSEAAPSIVHQEHVVPVRVLIDRMLKGDDPADVLDVAVVAHILASEHASIGPLVTKHAKLYSEMLGADLSELPALGRRRYKASGLRLRKVPKLVISSGALE